MIHHRYGSHKQRCRSIFFASHCALSEYYSALKPSLLKCLSIFRSLALKIAATLCLRGNRNKELFLRSSHCCVLSLFVWTFKQFKNNPRVLKTHVLLLVVIHKQYTTDRCQLNNTTVFWTTCDVQDSRELGELIGRIFATNFNLLSSLKMTH